MFFGEFRHNMDAKGRMSIPAKMRNQCGEVVYVTRGHEGCLDVYNEEGWNKFYGELSQLSTKKRKARQYLRIVNAKTRELEFDKMGRVNIPQDLRALAHLEKECVVIGAGDHMEIWNAASWDDYCDLSDDEFDELSEMLDEDEEA